MLSTLARQLGIVLLATSVVTAPVLGSMPRCCKTGAIAGGGNCCCADRENADRETGERAPAEPTSCCSQETRSCCAQAEVRETERSCCREADAPVVQDAAAANSLQSKCCCQSAAPLPAVPASKHRGESQEEQLVMTFVAIAGTPQSPHDAARGWSLDRTDPSAIPLRKIYCRWTV